MEVTVNYNQLNTLLPDLEHYAAVLESLSEEVTSLSYSCPTLKNVSKNIQANSSKVRQLKSSLEKTILMYNSTENQLSASTSSSNPKTSVASYARENNVENIFSTFNFSDYFVNDIGPLTGFGYFFSHFDDNMKALFNSCSSGKEFWERLLNGTLPNYIADEFMNDKESVKELLSGVVEAMFDNKVESKYKGSELKTMKALDDLMDDSFSSDIQKILDGSYATNKGLTKVSEAAEKVEYLLTDYSDNIDLLESLRRIAPRNQALNEVIDDVLFDYRHKFTALIRDEVIDKIEDFAKESFDSIAGTNFGLVNTAIKGTIGQIPAMDSLDTIIHISSVKSGAIHTYKTAVETIKSGAYTDSDFKAYVNSFNLCKELTLKEYRAMLSYYDNPYSKEHLYLQSQIRTLESMTYNNVSPAISFGQFNDGSGHGGLSSGAGGFGGGGGDGRFF